jgi:hypothetical protein
VYLPQLAMTTFEARSAAAAAATRAKVVLMSKIKEWRKAGVLYGTTTQLTPNHIYHLSLTLSLSLSLSHT